MFVWHTSDPPPTIEQHSKAKLTVLRSYLHDYFDRLGTIPSRDEFRLDLIDGFAGGGTFLDDNEVISGTPLIMLEESQAAQDRLNQNRTKPLRFDCKFHFVDTNPDHTAHLRKVLDEHGYKVDGEKVVVYTSPFEGVADEIISDVLRRQPRAGRSIWGLYSALPKIRGLLYSPARHGDYLVCWLLQRFRGIAAQRTGQAPVA